MCLVLVDEMTMTKTLSTTTQIHTKLNTLPPHDALPIWNKFNGTADQNGNNISRDHVK